ncbi:uncharacterized protein LOC116287600, partial [Actinia tenebrosa]|uniref:Uncharacterized protein LOC116287600 n=1 Tax=Actinia tenebrosa TaxID=6105 RepID=A0A6P8H3H0_ACTTE
MPTHCCVPFCTKKGYRDDNDGKISYFIFPKDNNIRKLWVHAIRREEGKSFQIVSSTKVCSRHFKEEDLNRTLAGKICLEPGVVPLVFPWRTSPRKRKPPSLRSLNFPSCSASNNAGEDRDNIFVESANIETIESVKEDFEKTREVETQTNFVEVRDFETQTDFEDVLKLAKDYETQIKQLETEIEHISKQKDVLKSKLFSVERFSHKQSSIAFYTGFPNYDVFMEIFTYLDPGDKGENIRYYTSTTSDVSPNVYDQEEEINENKRGRSRLLRPIDEYFLAMCRLRQGFAEEHIGHLFHVSTSTVSRILIS